MVWRFLANAAVNSASRASASAFCIVRDIRPRLSPRRFLLYGTKRSSEWAVAMDGDPFHSPIRGLVVAANPMLRAAVIPHRDRVRLPPEAATEIGRFDVPIKEAQQRGTLRRLHP